MKQIEVQIMGQGYLLGCPEGGEARLRDAVNRVDTAMCSIRDAGKVRARERIAVLAALNLVFDQPAPATREPSPDASAEPAAQVPADSRQAAQIRSLIERLDAALGDDGQLI
ncbi:MAG: cell division protein ZapA [Rhodoferax sp.]|nr:cell division protein ZapA [Rhodoferax sp.]